MPLRLRTILGAFAVPALALALSGPTPAEDEPELRVHSYASEASDVDAVNSHWFETGAGTVLIDAQRLLPEAERALEHLRSSVAEPVVAIVVTHAHTDHYGGLPLWVEAFPDATLYMDATTLASIRDDARGFIEARRRLHGRRFATHEALRHAVRNAVVVRDGETVRIGDTRLEMHVDGPSEAESTLRVALPERGVAFIGDLVNVGVPAVPFEDIGAWLEQLDALAADAGDDRLYQGHGPAPVSAAELEDQRRFLRRLSALVDEAVGDGVLDEAEQASVAFALEGEWPFLMGVAGQTRQEILAFGARRVALQRGARTEEGA